MITIPKPTTNQVDEPRVLPRRLQSLDTLRGFDMFWITGGSKLVHALAAVTGLSWLQTMGAQLHHPDWNGFHAYDLIFPLFIFMAGVSTPFSVGSRLEKGASRTLLTRKAIQRGLILVLLGIIYNNGILHTDLAETRFPSVLGRIGLAGMFAQIIYIYSPKRLLHLWLGILLLGYWAFMALFPVPGCGAGLLTMECNPASYFDRLVLPGRLHQTIHDPEGLVSTIPAVATGLFGILAGQLLRTSDLAFSPARKVLAMVLSGIAALALALVWNLVFPINKNIWTSSFVLLTAGLSSLLLALFYWVIDVQGYRQWTFFFLVIGMNSIVIYMSKKFFDFTYTANALFGGLLSQFPDSVQLVGGVVAFIMVQWVFMLILYRNKLFLKV
ncbi:acyltransferase family protein [Telluribacter sp. SYSU D00476]|uniref:acyltransferase family protein n=1 Tax=Telluribacter sp. SYSU D00476 TaxID=2811430 RepID=UPI001FF3E339|nr:DUF5009 domain-containing protein [Telluribacter sp. SYSU D00476]